MGEQANKYLKPFLRGRKIRPWKQEDVSEYIIYADRDFDVSKAPNVIKKHLNENKRALEERATVPESHYWYQLMQPQVGFVNDFENLEKIVWRDISNKPVTTLVGKKIYLDMTCYYIPIPDKAMCAWMNSDFFLEYLRLISSSLGPAVRWKKQWIEQVYFYPEKMKKQLEKIYDLSIKDPINGKLELNILINKFFKN